MKLTHLCALALALLVATGALAQTTKEAVLGGDASPAVLLDGEEIPQADLAGLETSQIGDIKILNGEQAMAEFGKYGEHGVIVVTGKVAGRRDAAERMSLDLEAIDEPLAESAEPAPERVTAVSADPYVVIDGEPATNAQLQALDAGRIESVNVLKGERATAKYGEKGRDGVIEVTTKG